MPMLRLALPILLVLGTSPARADQPALVPLPAEIVVQPGAGIDIGPATRIVVPAQDAAARAAATYLRDQLAATRHWRLAIVPGAAAKAGDIDFATDTNASGGDEAYRLRVSDKGVAIRAAGASGLFYGGVTLWDLLTGQPDATGPIHLDAMAIADRPRFAWRGLMLDSARHMQSVAYVERFLDWMALHKLNTFHWHLTDDQGWRIEIRHYPKLTSVGAWRKAAGPDATADDGTPVTRYGGFYTQAQIREVVAYAAARHITIVPEIDLPGHSTALIAAYPELGVKGFPVEPLTSDWGLLPEVLNTDDATFTTVENILTEVMDLFPGRYIHLGGDEADKTQWHASPAVQARMRALGLKDEAALERWFIGRLGTFLEAHGRRLVGWDEIQEGASGEGLDHDAIVMSWHGGPGAAAAVETGHDVVIAQAPVYYLNNRQANTQDDPPGWSDIIPMKRIYENDPVPAGLSSAEQAHVLGLQGQLWTERARREDWVTAFTYPRAAAIAEVGWTPQAKLDWSGFERRMATQHGRYRLLGLEPGSEAPDQPAGTRRTSLQLPFCDADTTGLVLEAPKGGVDDSKLVKLALNQPCWIYRHADLDGVARIDLSAVHLPFTYRLGSAHPIMHLFPPRSRDGEIDVRLDRVDGPLLASFPLADFAKDSPRYHFSLAVAGVQGAHDLYITVTGPDVDSTNPNRPPLTAIDRLDLE